MNILAEDFKNSVKTWKSEDPTVIRILLDGKYLILGNRNKSYWKRIADAKMCLKEHINNLKYDFFAYDNNRIYKHKKTGIFYSTTDLYNLQAEAYKEILKQVTFVKVNIK